MSTATKENHPTFQEIMSKAAKSAVRGGTAGAVAMGANVACLMWMRTTVSLKQAKDRPPPVGYLVRCVLFLTSSSPSRSLG